MNLPDLVDLVAGFAFGDDFLIAHRAAWLDSGGGTCVDRGWQAVGKREHLVRDDDAAIEIKSGFVGFPNGNARRVHTTLYPSQMHNSVNNAAPGQTEWSPPNGGRRALGLGSQGAEAA